MELKKFFDGGIRFLRDKNYRFLLKSSKGFYNNMPDEVFLKRLYKANLGKELDLENPKTFNEKLQWLKLYDRKPEYTKMVDKYEVKEYVAGIIGEEYIIPTLGVWDRFDDIDFDALPEQFVLKCTHDSGGLVICRDKEKLDLREAKHKIDKSLKCNFYYYGREWPYKNVKPRIIAEQYMEDEKTKELRDYKFFCFDGVAKALFIASDRQTSGEETKFDFFDMEFKHMDLRNGHPNADITPEKPENFEEMRTIAEKLSKKIPHLRVDFYEVNGKAYFGELTFSHWSGMVPFEPEEWDKTFGEWIKLPEKFGGGYALISNGYVLWLHREKTKGLTDYKFYCFNGKPEFLYVSTGLEDHSTARISFLTTDWKFASFKRSDYEVFETLPQKPVNFNEMLKLAEKLAQDTKFMRVDLYEIKNKVYFSELTFFPCSGMMPFEPEEWDIRLGDLLKLPETN